MARLWAFMMLLMSPVRPRENSVRGIAWALPPPAALPLMFMVGPPEGWRIAPPTFHPLLPRPSTRPMEVVVFPSPRGVGVMAVTSIYLPSGLSFSRSMIFMKSTLPIRPYPITSSFFSPISSPNCQTDFICCFGRFGNLPVCHLCRIVRHTRPP